MARFKSMSSLFRQGSAISHRLVSKRTLGKIKTTYRVRMGPGKPGKYWNFIMAFSRTGKSWKKATGPGKFWKFVKLD